MEPANLKVYEAINNVTAELAKVGMAKDRTNTFDNYKFRGIDDVYNALAPLLARHSLCVLPRILTRASVERETQKGGALFYVTVEAEFDFVCAVDGSKHTVRTFGEAMDRGDKATNKAMSAAYKYACFQAFCIPTEGDNDADATTHDVKPVKAVRITPTDGAMENVPADRQAVLRTVAAAAVEKFAEGNEWGAYEEVSQIADPEEKVAVWELLKPHSKLRATIKRLDQQQKEAA